MEIKGFIENSLLEWEGKIASIVFLPGCNLRCRYCHAAHLVLQPDELETVPRPNVLDRMRQHTGWLDGVCITGGEPTLHGEELVGLVRAIRDLGLQVMLETNGTRPEIIEGLFAEDLLDAIAMDFKAPLTPEDYRRITGADVDVDDVRQSIETIKAQGIQHEFRITLVPGLIGRPELVHMAPVLNGAQQVALQNFKPDFCMSLALRDVAPYASEDLDEFVSIFEPMVERVVVRGRSQAAMARSRAG